MTIKPETVRSFLSFIKLGMQTNQAGRQELQKHVTAKEAAARRVHDTTDALRRADIIEDAEVTPTMEKLASHESTLQILQFVAKQHAALDERFRKVAAERDQLAREVKAFESSGLGSAETLPAPAKVANAGGATERRSRANADEAVRRRLASFPKAR